MLARDQLQRGAADGGFQIESYEKVCVLIELLGAIRAHPFLGHRMALKGGTALNLFLLDFPRLSVGSRGLFERVLSVRREADRVRQASGTDGRAEPPRLVCRSDQVR